MAVQDYKINYKSDFVLTINGDAGWAVPFCIKFWTGMPSQAYFVGFDGVKYVNCRLGDTPTQLLVMFDDHHLPIGPLRMQIAYHTTIAEFPGSVFDEVTNARDVIVDIDGTDYQVLLDFTGEDAPELEFDLPAYANEAERIQNELQRQQNEADRIAAELQREQATAAAVQGAENVNAQLSGNILTVTNRNGVSTSVNTKGEQGEQGPVGPEGPQGQKGVSVTGLVKTGETDTDTLYNVTFSDGTTQAVAIPKGAKGDTGATGPTGPQGPQGQTGVSITGLVKTGETETDTLYNVTFSNGTTQAVAIPKGEKGDKGDTGNPGPQGVQGPKGDTVTATDYTLYNVQGSDSQGAMSQDATTKAISAQTGYYTCGTAAGTPEKVVTVENGNLYKRTLGGHFKVEMTNKNTAASGVTLQIGSETAAALWYNGAAVSATNTWDAGEVISVYYDGTYYQASNAQGGSNKKIDAYLYGDLKTLAVGQTYNVDEAVKTADNQLLRVNKEVKAMNIFDTVATGDLVAIASGTYLGTYKAQKAVNNYNNNTTYTDGAYAIGSPAKQVITVDISGRASEIAEGSTIVVTVNGIAHSISITSEKTAAQIASELSSAIGNIGGWTKTYTENEDSITLKCNIAGVNTISFSFSDPNETGVVVSNTVSAGTTVLCQYDETNDSWSTVSLSDYASNSVAVGETDETKMWKKLDITGLTAYTLQNTIDSELVKSYKTELKLVRVSLQNGLYANASTAGSNFGLTYSDGSRNWGVSAFINVEDCVSISIWTSLRDKTNRKNVVGGVFYTDAKNDNSCAMTAGAWVMPGNSWDVGWKTLPVPEGARYFRTSCGLSKGSTVYYLTKKEPLAETTKQVYDFRESLIPLSLGVIYQKGDVVADDNGNLFRFTKTIELVNTTDAVSIGDVKVQGSNTYKALKNISAYSATVARSSASYPYSAGSYTVGRPSIHTITVTADTVTAGNVTLTVGNVSRVVAISAGESVADIVSSIATAITGVVSYWVITTARNVITLECKKTITNALNFAFTDTDSTGVNVSVSKVSGAETVSKYDGSNWAAVTVSDLVSDLSMFEKVDKDWILSHICEPEYNNYNVNVFDISKESVGSNSINTTVKKTETGFRCTCVTPTVQSVGYMSIHGLTPGRYKISFNSSFSNVINADTTVQAGFLRIKNGNTYNSSTLWNYCVTLNQGTLTSYFTCTTSSVLYFVFHNTDLGTANSWIELSNIKIQKASSYQTEINDINSRIEALNNNIKVPTSYTGTYTGKEIDLGHNTHYYSMRNSYTNVIDAQALAIYGKYMIRISNGTQPVNKNKAALYYLNDDGTTSLIWKVDLNADHANSAQFGTFIAPNSTFPYLYVSSLDNPACYVYRITLDGTIEKVQTIRTSLPKGRNLQCGDDGFIYYYNAWTVSKYRLPSVGSGDVTLEADDLIENYSTRYGGSSTGQGGLIHDGKLYCPLGGLNRTDRRLVVIDLITHRFLTEIVFDGIIPNSWEPEDIDIMGNELYMGCSQNNKGLYIIKFIQ